MDASCVSMQMGCTRSSSTPGAFRSACVSTCDGNLIVADADKPFVRKLLGALPPSRLTPSGTHAFVLGLDSDGNVIHNLQDPNSEFSTTTSAVRNGKRLYICSLTADAVGVLELP
jgi:hypothetical protein